MHQVRESHIVPTLVLKTRLSDYAKDIFETIPSRKGMKKAIDKGWVTINGNKAKTGDWLLGGETIALTMPEAKTKPVLQLSLDVLFEDDFLAVINKPAGIEVSGNGYRTVESALQFNLKPSSQKDAVLPQAIHRLDFPTSGVLLIGKTLATITALNKLFEHREIEKQYHAICVGEMQNSGAINLPVDGKSASSKFMIVSRLASQKYNGLNLVKLTLETGRRHQLRKHLSSIGNPILGDKQYGVEGKIMAKTGLFLHASFLKFTHPVTEKEVSVSSELPKKFGKLFP